MPSSTSTPLLVDDQGIIALDARIVVRKPTGAGAGGPARHPPYPVELECEIEHRGQRLRLRPIRPQDEDLLQAFVQHMTAEDIRLRFFGPMRELTHEMAARLTQIDYDRDMAFLLLDGETLLGVGRLAADPGFGAGGVCAGRGVGPPAQRLRRFLLRHVVDYAQRRGIKRVVGYVLRENKRMLDLAERVGFEREGGAAPAVSISAS